MKQKLFSVVLAAASLAMVGCSKSDNQESEKVADALNKMKDASQNANAAAELKKETVKASSLPAADLATAEEKYIKVDSGVQVAFLYYAVTGLPPDYEKLTPIFSKEYRSTQNEFKKKEILDAVKPKIDERISYFKENRYVKVDTDFSLDHIDMATKSFPLDGVPGESRYIYFYDDSTYKVGVANGEKFKHFTAASDEQAREIENMVEKGRARGKLDMFLFAQDADMSSGIVKFQLVKARLTDKGGKVLGELK